MLAIASLALIGSLDSPAAEPVALKLSFFTSQTELVYQAAVKPFIDAVNREGEGQIRIDAYADGVLGQHREQAELLLRGDADIALVNPGLTPDRFPDQAMMQLPGIFRSSREATLAYNALVGADAFHDLNGFLVIGALVNYPLILHTRPPVTSIADLKGKRLRVSSTIEGDALRSLGAIALVTPINEVESAMGRDMLDGAIVPPGSAFDFGIARVASYHYLISFGATPLLLMMNANRFAALSPDAQDVIRRFSGGWVAEHYLEKYIARTESVLETLKTNPRRTVTVPSSADTERAQTAFASARAEWLAARPRNREIFDQLQSALTELHRVPRAAESAESNENTTNR
jgi:TRAP-type C4-dicarboxylate transport system substrate-binding protein